MAKKILAFCAALMAFAVVPAAASASPELTSPAGTTLAAGSAIQATSIGKTIMTPGVECDTAFMTGTLKKNNGTEIEGEITKAEFHNAGKAACSATFGSVTVTTSVENGLPYCIKANSKMKSDEFQLSGGACGSPRNLSFIFDLSSGGTCTYVRTTATGPVIGTYTTAPEDAKLTVSEQAFTKTAGSILCPSTGKLDMTFTLETDPGGSAILVS